MTKDAKSKSLEMEATLRGLLISSFGSNIRIDPERCEIIGQRQTSSFLGLRKRSVEIVAVTITADGAGQNIYEEEWANIGVRMKPGFKSYESDAKKFAEEYQRLTGRKAIVY